jgi:hypothetical protein
MVLRTHIIPSVYLKYDFGEVDEAMFPYVEDTCDVIFRMLWIEKSDLYVDA